MKVKVVIGANYGDEGKGLVTNFLTRQAKERGEHVIVCLCNGGAQRGHTVLNDGVKHVFSHFGSGTLSGADTYIDKNFIFNPMLFVKEYVDLYDIMFYKPNIYVDSEVIVTTPFDMIINQMVCKYYDMHNSCGVGIWETEKNRYNRNKIKTLKWFYQCFSDGEEYKIRDYLQNRYKNLNIDITKSILEKYKEDSAFLKMKSIEYKKMLNNNPIDDCIEEYCKDIDFNGLINHWIEDLKIVFRLVELDNKSVLRNEENTIIVENGQGLLLSKNKDLYYGTPSDTTWSSALNILEYLNMGPSNVSYYHDDLELVYVSRPYITRHGDGPMIGEPINPPEKDLTNVPNDWQGSIRYSSLDIKKLPIRICNDANRIALNHHCRVSLYITHGQLVDDAMIEDLLSLSINSIGSVNIIDCEDYPNNKTRIPNTLWYRYSRQ